MTVQELSETLSLKVFHLADPDHSVSGGYCGDLLSWVMGRASADSVWLTIMSNVNVAAVASLSDVACVVLTEAWSRTVPCLSRLKRRASIFLVPS